MAERNKRYSFTDEELEALTTLSERAKYRLEKRNEILQVVARIEHRIQQLYKDHAHQWASEIYALEARLQWLADYLSVLDSQDEEDNRAYG